MKSIINFIKMFILFIILVVGDQLSKYWAVITLKDNDPISIIKDVFELRYLDGGNTGAAWGIFSGKILMFVIFTLIVVFIIIFLIFKLEYVIDKPKYLRTIQVLFVILSAGAVGNLIDRIIHNYVIDFLYFKLINFPIFNVADCYVTVSCALLLIICIFFLSEDDFNKIFSFKRNIKENKEQ